jgi:probable rRNA maturation factor
MNCELEVLRDSELTDVPHDEDFQAWVDAALADHAVALAIRLVDAEESRALNQRYRDQDKPTNVLSFPSDLPAGVRQALECPPLGDLVICAPVVRAEALEQGKPEAHHWAHLTVHGVLHLCGFDHGNDADAERMEQREIDVLGRLGIPDPYTVNS